MCVDCSEDGGANTVHFVLFEWDMVRRSGVAKFFGEAKVDDVYEMRGFTGSHYKVGGLDITMDKIFGVDELDAGYLDIMIATGTD
jgi:hypothetical protein